MSETDPRTGELMAWVANARMLRSRLASRSRTEIFYPGSLAPELMRRSEELFGEGIEAALKLVNQLTASSQE